MTVQDTIEQKILTALTPSYLDVINESHMHSGPALESHFKLIIVSSAFDSVRLVARHQQVYKVLADELAGEVHALALHTFTEKEWEDKKGDVRLSPNCLGGGK